MSYFDDLDSGFNGDKVSKEVLTDEQIRERVEEGRKASQGVEGTI